MEKIIKKILGPKVCDVLRRLLNSPKKQSRQYFEYDQKRFLEFSGVFAMKSRERSLALIIALYHIVEKGLTMPNRRFTFGVAVLRDLMKLINEFVIKYDKDEPQVLHAIGVIKAYYELHQKNGIENVDGDPGFFEKIDEFVKAWPKVPVSNQISMNREEYFAKRTLSFPEFSSSRNTVRHYSDR